ncbi:MAG: DEAD/DEAH box helicase [Pseudomonadota bacterium]
MRITENDIEATLSERSFSNALAFYNNNPVLKYHINKQSKDLTILAAHISEMFGQNNTLELIIRTKQNKLEIQNKCSCKKHHCPHSIAIALQYCKNQEQERKKHISTWLKSISTRQLTTNNNIDPKYKYIIYSENDVSLIDEKDQLININELEYVYTNTNESTILDVLKSQTDDSGSCAIKLSGKIGSNLLVRMIKTNRCYYKSATVPLKFNTKPWNLRWCKLSDEYSKIKSNIDHTNHHIIKTNPVMAIDHSNNTIITINNKVDKKTFDMLINAPLVPKESINDVFKYISIKFPHIPLNTPDNYKLQRINERPKPTIELKQRLIYGKDYYMIALIFIYGKKAYKHLPIQSIHTIFDADKKIEIIRDIPFEKQCIQKLEQIGFSHPLSKINSYYSFPLEKDEQMMLSHWYHFLSTGTNSLHENGYNINIDESFKLEFIKDTQIHIDSEENDEGWFSLGFDIEIGDIKTSLLPIVTEIISQYDDIRKIPPEIFYKIEQYKYIKINAKDLLPIIETITQLLNRRTKDNKFTIPSNELHLLGDLDEIDVIWKGTKEVLELSKQLRKFNGIKPVSEPNGLVYPLRDYQKEGLNWLAFLKKYRFNGILADDMGLGKTLQILACLLRLKEKGQLDKPSIVVVPTSLVHNWKNEAEKFTPDLKTLIIYGIDRVKMFDHVATSDLIITTYGNIRNDYHRYVPQPLKYIIVDEAHNIKNHKTKSYKALMKLKSENRICVSGTPIENNLGELWSLMNFVMPGFLNNENQFNKLYRHPIEKHGSNEAQLELNKRIKPFIMRRTKNEVLNELPNKTEINKYIQLDGKQAKLYESIRVTTEKEVREIIKQKKKNNNFHILNALLQLRQVCCDPKLLKIKNAKNVASAKKDMFFELVAELLNDGHKILVFSQFAQMLYELEKGIQKKKIPYSILTGKSTKRETIISKFTDGDSKIFLISLKTGGVGLNLTQADTVIHYDHWWNPAKENQATDRAHRMGQKQPVFVYKLIVENSIESKIIEMQKSKLALSEAIYGNDKQALEKITSDDLLNLVK